MQSSRQSANFCDLKSTSELCWTTLVRNFSLSLPFTNHLTHLTPTELILLTIDEAIDHGQIMELDSNAIVSRVLMRGSESNVSSSNPSAPDMSIRLVWLISVDLWKCYVWVTGWFYQRFTNINFPYLPNPPYLLTPHLTP